MEDNGERDDDGDAPLPLHSTEKRLLSFVKDKCRVKRRVKRHHFSSLTLSEQGSATGDESDIMRLHIFLLPDSTVPYCMVALICN